MQLTRWKQGANVLCMQWKQIWLNAVKTSLLLALVAFALFESEIHRQCEIYREYADVFSSFQRMLLLCLAIWCWIFLRLTIGRRDLLLASFLLATLTTCFGVGIHQDGEVAITLFGVTIGRATYYALRYRNPAGQMESERRNLCLTVIIFWGLIMLLSFVSWFHSDMSHNYYRGPRWMGVWDNPNIYGILMGVGVILVVGLLKGMRKMKKLKRIFLIVAIVMLGVGLMMSYSRGAWLATTVGLFYMAWYHGKLKWWHIIASAGLAVIGILLFWGQTPESAPWFVKRADLGRPSALHRSSAWRAGLEIMLDHPFGVGWNNAVKTYQDYYNPPEGGAAALTTNDYMMIGTELGIPALLCFVGYAALCLRGKLEIEIETGRIQAACRAGAIVFLVAFWFDGGLFKLPTAALFWVLLELGAGKSAALPASFVGRLPGAEIVQK